MSNLQKGFFGGFIYSIWKLTLFPGFFVHQWNIRVEDLPRILYVRINEPRLGSAS